MQCAQGYTINMYNIKFCMSLRIKAKDAERVAVEWISGYGHFHCKCGKPEFSPQIHMKVEGENQLDRIVLWPPQEYRDVCLHMHIMFPHAHTHTHTACKFFYLKETSTEKVIWFHVSEGIHMCMDWKTSAPLFQSGVLGGVTLHWPYQCSSCSSCARDWK